MRQHIQYLEFRTRRWVLRTNDDTFQIENKMFALSHTHSLTVARFCWRWFQVIPISNSFRFDSYIQTNTLSFTVNTQNEKIVLVDFIRICTFPHFEEDGRWKTSLWKREMSNYSVVGREVNNADKIANDLVRAGGQTHYLTVRLINWFCHGEYDFYSEIVASHRNRIQLSPHYPTEI